MIRTLLVVNDLTNKSVTDQIFTNERIVTIGEIHQLESLGDFEGSYCKPKTDVHVDHLITNNQSISTVFYITITEMIAYIDHYAVFRNKDNTLYQLALVDRGYSDRITYP